MEAWIDAVPSAWKQVVAMRAICLAYPYVRVRPVWREKIAILEDAMHLRPDEHVDLVRAAMAAAEALKAA
jgi:hypothetical protein